MRLSKRDLLRSSCSKKRCFRGRFEPPSRTGISPAPDAVAAVAAESGAYQVTQRNDARYSDDRPPRGAEPTLHSQRQRSWGGSSQEWRWLFCMGGDPSHPFAGTETCARSATHATRCLDAGRIDPEQSRHSHSLGAHAAIEIATTHGNGILAHRSLRLRRRLPRTVLRLLLCLDERQASWALGHLLRMPLRLPRPNRRPHPPPASSHHVPDPR